MDLFRQQIDQPENFLPNDGIAKYYGILIAPQQADEYFDRLLNNIDWQHDEAIILGKRMVTKRKVAWHADQPFRYTYSKITKRAKPWTEELLELKAAAENKTGETFNSCLLNLYHNGSEAMAWHSDGEKDLEKNGAIGSLSFGAERKFSFKNKKTKQTLSLTLEHGSLLVMEGATQRYWQHRLPPMAKVDQPRINLTFRKIVCAKTLTETA